MKMRKVREREREREGEGENKLKEQGILILYILEISIVMKKYIFEKERGRKGGR